MPDLKTSIAFHYHERTKYHPETIAAKNKGLDWSQQPSPFKDYKIGHIYDLKPYLADQDPTNAEATSWQRLSRLLGASYGLTAKIPAIERPIFLRSAPSAGGLYPAEMYLVSRGTPLLAAGLYNYQPKTHSLIHFWPGEEVWGRLQEACFEHPALAKTQLAIVTTAVFYRSVWRYEDRAYRRIFLDTGHLIGNIELVGAINHYRPHLIGGFQDGLINELFYLDPDEEAVMTVIALADLTDSQQHFSASTTALPSDIHTDYPRLADGELLSYFHQATEIRDSEPLPTPATPQKLLEDKYNFPFCLKISTQSPPIDWKEDLIKLENTILKRRSTRAYTKGDITLDELKAALHFTYQPQAYANQGLEAQPDYFDLSLISTFVAVSSVTGLEEGCYYYAPKAQELRQIRFKNFRSELHYLCLGQELGRDAAAVVFHTADLQQAVAKYGERAYRYLHVDAGHLGQRLNLAAVGLNFGVSGIGGFFDDKVNEVLSIPEDEAVLYITTLGRPRGENG